MHVDEYKRMYNIEDTYWWYRGLHEFIISTLLNFFPDIKNKLLLDVGCGTGGLLENLRDFCPKSFGTEISPEGLKFCGVRNLSGLFRGSATTLALKDNIGDGVICLDVIQHKRIQSDMEALREFHRILKPGGILILNLPAFSLLKGAHDLVVQTRERYTMNLMKHRLDYIGFKILKMTYRNAILFPLIMIKRLLDSLSNAPPRSDLKPLPPWLNRILFKLVCMENLALAHINVPFGSSLFCIAQK